MPTQTIAVPKPLEAVRTEEVEQQQLERSSKDEAPSTPPAVSRLPLFRCIAPGDEADGPAAAGSAAPSCKLNLAPLTPPSSPPASPVNAEPANSAEADGDTVDGETVVVFDWDDTLMATTVLTRQVRRRCICPARVACPLVLAHALRRHCSTVSTSMQRIVSPAGWSHS